MYSVKIFFTFHQLVYNLRLCVHSHTHWFYVHSMFILCQCINQKDASNEADNMDQVAARTHKSLRVEALTRLRFSPVVRACIRIHMHCGYYVTQSRSVLLSMLMQIPYTVTMQCIVALSHITFAYPSLFVSQKHVAAVFIPAPFFC